MPIVVSGSPPFPALSTLGGITKEPNKLYTNPKNFDIAISETLPYVVDVTNYLAGTDNVSNIHSVLFSLATPNTVITTPWQQAIHVVGNVITITINGSALSKGQTYQLNTTFTANTGVFGTSLPLIVFPRGRIVVFTSGPDPVATTSKIVTFLSYMNVVA